MANLSKKLVASVAVAAMLAGCATVSSTHLPADDASVNAAGLTYFLPMRKVKFTATRMTTAKLEAAAEKAKAAADEAAGKRDELKQKLEAAQAAAEAEEDAAKKAKLEENAAEIEGEFKTAEAKAKELAAAAKKANTLFEEASAAGGCTYTAKMELMPAQADVRFRYVARMLHSSLRDDRLDLKLAPTGLLNSGKVEATDRTGDVLVEAAALIGASQTGGTTRLPSQYYSFLQDLPGIKAVEDEDTDTDECAALPPQFLYVFDPIADGVDPLNRALAQARFPFFVKTERPAFALAEPATWQTFTNAKSSRPNRLDGAGLYYRSGAPVGFTIYQAGPDLSAPAFTRGPAIGAVRSLEDLRALAAAAKPEAPVNPCFAASAIEPLRATDPCLKNVRWQPIDAVVANIPQAGPISYIPMTATAFVKAVDDVQFTDGQVTSWTRDRPSEVLAFVKLPAQALERLSSLLTLRVTYTNNVKTLDAAQREEMLADVRWRELDRCVKKARREGADVKACLPE